jgi:hypothetical protein
MEPVPPHAPVVEPRIRNRVPPRDLGQRRVERGIEACDVRPIGEGRAGGREDGDRDRVVERSERSERLQPADDVVVDEDGCTELRAAVDDPVTDDDRGLGRRAELAREALQQGVVVGRRG